MRGGCAYNPCRGPRLQHPPAHSVHWGPGHAAAGSPALKPPKPMHGPGASPAPPRPAPAHRALLLRRQLRVLLAQVTVNHVLDREVEGAAPGGMAKQRKGEGQRR